MRGTRLVPVACAAAVMALPASVASPASSTWRGTATGTQVRTRHHDEQTSPNVVWDDSQHYGVRLQFSFSIASDGDIAGTGTGTYGDARWHMAGTNEHAAQDNPPKDPHFSCDPPITAKPFDFDVKGHATSTHVTLSLAIPKSGETAADYDCGADFTGYGSTTHYVAASLQAVGGGALSFSRDDPHVPTLTKDEPIDSGKTTGHAVSTWAIHVTAPGSGSGSSGSGSSGSSAPTASGNPPDRSVCTIKGTAHADTLNGTSGRDVICAFGGDDLVRGRGGNDVVYAGSGKDRITPGPGRDTVSAGPGADRIVAHDGKRDRIDGGSGKDSAWTDHGVDKVTHVEHVT